MCAEDLRKGPVCWRDSGRAHDYAIVIIVFCSRMPPAGAEQGRSKQTSPYS